MVNIPPYTLISFVFYPLGFGFPLQKNCYALKFNLLLHQLSGMGDYALFWVGMAVS